MITAASELQALLQTFDRNAHHGGDLSLGPIETVLERLGRPQDRFPPTIHIAGTNGKGSTAAFIRSMAEAAGLRVHVSTSPHLVRVNERVRLAGDLIDDEYFLQCCRRAAKAGTGITTSYFELTFAAAALAFSETPADLLVLEVGLGGRLDATNIIERPAVSVITPIALDHQAILGSTIARIAFEKAGIIKLGCPVVSALQTSDAAGVIAEEAFAKSAPLHTLSPKDIDDIASPIALEGAHQKANAALASKALEVWAHPAITEPAIRTGLQTVSWPARLQKLKPGPLTDQFKDLQIWLDGGHNPHGAAALSDVIAGLPDRSALVFAMLQAKEAKAYLEALSGLDVKLITCPMPAGHAGHSAETLADIGSALGFEAWPASSLNAALWRATELMCQRALVCGSLYMAGAVLEANEEIPI
ncbi:MAG: folylpolyglutamate synthase/dihydrofolate synthase family protein [Pseudomonadota bacterium]